MRRNGGTIPLTSEIIFLPSTLNPSSRSDSGKKPSAPVVDNSSTRSSGSKRKYSDDSKINETGKTKSSGTSKTISARLNPTACPGYGVDGPPGATVTERCYYSMVRPDFDFSGEGEQKIYFFEIMALEFRACGETFIKRILDAIAPDESSKVEEVSKGETEDAE